MHQERSPQSESGADLLRRIIHIYQRSICMVKNGLVNIEMGRLILKYTNGICRGASVISLLTLKR